jgi:hypothetical protein
MKRFFTIVTVAVLLSSAAFSNLASAAWGTGGWGVPVGPPVGQSSQPSNHPASAPINTPFNPNGNLGAVPGSYKDPVAMAGKSKAWQAAQIAKAKANFDKKQYSPRLAPQNLNSPMSVSPNQRPSMNMNTNADAAARYNMGRYGSKYGPYTPPSQRPNPNAGTYGGMNSQSNSNGWGGYGGQPTSQYGMFAR